MVVVFAGVPTDISGLLIGRDGTLQVATPSVDYVVPADLNAKQDVSAKNQPNGYAGLDGAGLVPSALLPSSVRLHVQSSPSASWVVPHGLDHRPLVQLLDDSGHQVFADVTVDLTNIAVAFSTPQTGSLLYQ